MLSRRILAAAAVLCALAAPAQAQKTKAEITTEINTLFPDNTSGQITALGLRTVTNDIATSIMPTAPVVSGNLACFNGTTGLLQDCGVSPTGIYLNVTGDVTISAGGVSTVTSNFLNAPHTWGAAQTLTVNQNAASNFVVSNNSTATGALAQFLVQNSLSAASFGIGGSGYTGFGGFLQNRAFVYTGPATSGISIFADGALPIDFYVSSARAGGFTSAGLFTLTTPLAASSGGTGLSSLGAGCATWLGTPSSANLRGCISDETGSGLAYFQGGDIGTPSAGNGSNLTALNATQLTSGTIPAARTNGHQNGTATNDSAAAGEIGELIEATLVQGSATSLTTATGKDIITISLAAGDWDVSAITYFIPTATTSMTAWASSISTTANTLDTTAGRWGQWAGPAQVDANAIQKSQAAGPYRLSLSGTTTVRLVAQSTFTASTLTAYGYIRARRMR